MGRAGYESMPVVELYCDHPECSKDHPVLKTASDVVAAQKLIDAGDVRCPLHGVRTEPILVGRHDPHSGH